MNHSLIAGALFVLAATPALAMEMTEVPAHVAEVARHFAPEAKWESAGTDFDTQLMAPEYEIKGKTADGKGIEIDVSPEGNLHEIELVIDESSVPPRPYPVRRRVSRPAWVCDEVRSTMVAFLFRG